MNIELTEDEATLLLVILGTHQMPGTNPLKLKLTEALAAANTPAADAPPRPAPNREIMRCEDSTHIRQQGTAIYKAGIVFYPLYPHSDGLVCIAKNVVGEHGTLPYQMLIDDALKLGVTLTKEDIFTPAGRSKDGPFMHLPFPMWFNIDTRHP